MVVGISKILFRFLDDQSTNRAQNSLGFYFFDFFCNTGIDSTYNILYASRSIFILVNFGYKNTSLVFSLLPEQLHFVFFLVVAVLYFI